MKTPKKPRAKTSFRAQSRKIDLSDIPETDDAFWAKAEGRVPGKNGGTYLRIDADVLGWFKKQGNGYQTRINAVLRAYIEVQKTKA